MYVCVCHLTHEVREKGNWGTLVVTRGHGLDDS